MKAAKKDIGLLVVIAFVVSSLLLGIWQLKAGAATNAGGTGVFRLDIQINQNDTSCDGNRTKGTDSRFRLQLLNADGVVVSATPDSAITGYNGAGVGGTNPLEANQTTSFTFDGMATGANVNVAVPSLAALTVDKTITQMQLVCTYYGDDWTFNNVVLYYSLDGSTGSWVALTSGSWGPASGGFSTWSVGAAFTTTYLKTLAFNPHGAGGSGSGGLYAIAGQTITAPVVSMPGYTFEGWSPVVPARMPNVSQTYTAQWTPLYSTITFDANGGRGGTEPTSMLIGSVLSRPTVTRTGYTFVTWSPSVPSDVPAIDKTYTAVWLKNDEVNENTYNITFNANGGSGTMPAQVLAFGQTSALASNVYTKTNYSFKGWATSQAIADSGYAEYYKGDNYTIGANDITLFAVWVGNPYTIDFSSNGGSGDTSGLMDYGSALTAPAVTKVGYTLSGWYPAVPSTVPSVDTTYTAQWTVNTYTVVYDGNGSTGGTTASSTHTYGISKALTSNGFTKENYNFAGWAPSSTGSKLYNDNESVANLTATNTITLYAVWSNRFYITFSPNGGSGGSSGYQTAGDPLVAPTVTRAGRTFVGWSPTLPATVPAAATTYTAIWDDSYMFTFNANGGTGGTIKCMNAGTAFKAPSVSRTGYTLSGWSPALPSTVPSANAEYTALWSAISYTVTFDANEGTGGTSSSKAYGTALTAPAVTRTGHTLVGWSTTLPATVPAANTTYIAIWDDTYLITFNTSGWSGVTSTYINAGSTLTAPTITRTGYTYGWSPAVPATVPAENTTYTLQWIANTYIVTFDAQGGTVSPTSSTVTYHSTYGAGTGGFPIPIRPGYTFGGWYTSTGGAGNKRLSTDTVYTASAQTLYAKWTVVTNISITFNANGGTGGTSSLKTYGASLTAPTVTRAGHTFVGWSPTVPATVPAANTTYTAIWDDSYLITFDANGATGGSSTYNNAGDTLTAPTVTKTGYTLSWSPVVPATVPAENTIYTAQWTANTYTVNYDGNGSTAGSMASTLHTYDISSNLSANNFTRVGYSFLGWSRNQSATAAAYTSRQSVLNLTPDQGAVITLYAVWSVSYYYTITFNANDGTGGSSASMLQGSVLTAPAVARTGYTFAGWSPEVPATVPAANTTYTALWTANTYSVNYNGNGSTAGSTANSHHTYDVAASLTANGFTKIGNTFLGWSADSGAASAGYTNGQIVINLTAESGAVVTFYAVWSANQYRVNFNPDGGQGSLNFIMVTYGTAYGTLPTLTKAGCTFNGWYTAQNGGGTNISSTTTVTITAMQTLYANWTVNDGYYKIIFDANGGTGGTYVVKYPGETLIAPTVSRANYAFQGWSPSLPATAPAANTTYTAIWSENFVDGDYTYSVYNSKSTIVKYNGVLSNLTLPSELGGYPVTTIGKMAFYPCNLQTVNLPDSLRSIGECAFYLNDALSSVSLPVGLTDIGLEAFAYCYALTQITIPDSVISVGEGAFYCCTGIRSVNIGSGLSSLGSQAFTQCSSLTRITVNSQNAKFSDVDGVLFDKNKTNLICYPIGTAGTYNIPSGVETISDAAFLCSRLTSVTIPNSVKTIGIKAFGSSAITSVTIPNSVTSIGSEAFMWCTDMTAAYFMGSAPTLDGSSVFARCASGFTVYHLSNQTGFTSPTWNGYPTAVFSPISITFDANGGTGGTSTSNTSGTALTPPVVTKPGYVFAGWSPAVPATVPAENTTYTAQWTAKPSVSITKLADGFKVSIQGWAAGNKYQIWSRQQFTDDLFAGGTASQWILSMPYALGSAGTAEPDGSISFTIADFVSPDSNYTIAVRITDAGGNYLGEIRDSYTPEDVSEVKIAKVLVDEVYSSGREIREIKAGASMTFAVIGNNVPGTVFTAKVLEGGSVLTANSAIEFGWDISALTPGTYTVQFTATNGATTDTKNISVQLYSLNTGIQYGNISSLGLTAIEDNTLPKALTIDPDFTNGSFYYRVGEPGRKAIFTSGLFQPTDSIEYTFTKYGIYQVAGFVNREYEVRIGSNYDDGFIKSFAVSRSQTEPSAATLTATVNAEPINLADTVDKGTAVKFEANAAIGGIGTTPVVYSFWRYDAKGYALVKDWSSDNTLDWTPGRVGNYSIEVRAKGTDAGSYEVAQSVKITVTDNTDQIAQGVVITLNESELEANAQARAPITIKANATSSNSDDLLYKFNISDSAMGGRTEQHYSPDSNCIWTPRKAGTYTISVLVKNTASFGAYDAAESFEITVS